MSNYDAKKRKEAMQLAAYKDFIAKRDEEARQQAHPVSLPEVSLELDNVCADNHKKSYPPEVCHDRGETVSPEREEMRKRNREKYPEFAAFYDEVVKHFPGARIISIREFTPEEKAEREAQVQAKGME